MHSRLVSFVNTWDWKMCETKKMPIVLVLIFCFSISAKELFEQGEALVNSTFVKKYDE